MLPSVAVRAPLAPDAQLRAPLRLPLRARRASIRTARRGLLVRRAARAAAAAAAAASAAVKRRWWLGLLLWAPKSKAAAPVKIHALDDREVEIPGAKADTLVARALDKFVYPSQWPYVEKDFFRLDRGDDSEFYAEPRLVKHLDDKALGALTDFYARVFPKDRDFAALDVCSSWVSHYPEPKPKRLAITGMNAEELKRNAQASDWKVQDLNANPKLPYGDAEFDVVTNTVSVDYLTQPLQVFREVGRVLRPGGLAIVAFSNRCFLSKLVSIWSVGDLDDRVEVAANYFHFAEGFKNAEVVDLSPPKTDPLVVVCARRV